jgi:hypothetical protein
MTFDEWFDSKQGIPYMTTYMFAKDAWDASKQLEREECAKICEKDGLGAKYQGDVYASAIRSKE